MECIRQLSFLKEEVLETVEDEASPVALDPLGKFEKKPEAFQKNYPKLIKKGTKKTLRLTPSIIRRS